MTDTEFREAYQRHKDVLHRFAWRMTGSPAAAEDAVHDCFLIFLRNPSGYDATKGTLRSFLIGVTRNLALKQLRGQSRFDEFDEENAVPELPDFDAGNRAGMISRAVASLPPLQREVLILAEYEEMSLEEISRAVGAELAAVKSRLHRARENMRRMLAPLLNPKGIVYGSRQ